MSASSIVKRLLAAVLATIASAQGALAQTAGNAALPAKLAPRPADRTDGATSAPLLAATTAGPRVVATGDYGVVLLSDDAGKSWRQAKSVPVSSALTAVHFADVQRGWAVGHWGAIVSTVDGGETWTLQRVDVSEDRPLFAVHAFDGNDAVAVGLWSLILATHDGGNTWNNIAAPKPPDGGKADRNLFATFAGRDGELWVAAERGTLLHTADRGRSWRYVATGYKGSFWTGIRLASGTLLAAGLRGTVYRSADDGRTWSAIASGTKSSITALIEAKGELRAIGLDGVMLTSTDDGLTFRVQQRDDRMSYTAAAVTPVGSSFVLFGKAGVMAP